MLLHKVSRRKHKMTSAGLVMCFLSDCCLHTFVQFVKIPIKIFRLGSISKNKTIYVWLLDYLESLYAFVCWFLFSASYFLVCLLLFGFVLNIMFKKLLTEITGSLRWHYFTLIVIFFFNCFYLVFRVTSNLGSP